LLRGGGGRKQPGKHAETAVSAPISTPLIDQATKKKGERMREYTTISKGKKRGGENLEGGDNHPLSGCFSRHRGEKKKKGSSK